MERIVLSRTGQGPLAFEGEMLSAATGKMASGKGRSRWHNLAVYQPAGGKYVVAILYETEWPGEHGHSLARVVDTAAEVPAVFREYDPSERVHPLPDHYEKAKLDQNRRINLLVQDYQQRVTEVLGDKFVETVA